MANIFDVFSLPVIVSVINDFLSDDDKFSLLESSSRFYYATGLSIDQFIGINYALESYILESSIKIKLLWDIENYAYDYYDVYVGENITDIEIVGVYDSALHEYIENLPAHVNISISTYFVRNDVLSDRITTFTYNAEDYNKLTVKIPDSVVILRLIGIYAFPINGLVPRSVTTLELGKRFKHPIKNVIPDSVTTMILCNPDYDQELPESISTLILNKRHISAIDKLKLTVPSNVRVEFI